MKNCNLKIRIRNFVRNEFYNYKYKTGEDCNLIEIFLYNILIGLQVFATIKIVTLFILIMNARKTQQFVLNK